LLSFDEEKYAKIMSREDFVDRYEGALGAYLVRVNTKELSEKETQTAARYLSCLTNLERISDHAVNLAERSQDMKAANLAFSDVAKAHLTVITDALNEIVTLTNNALHSWNEELFARVEPLEQVIDGLTEQMKDFHIARLRTGECTLETGVAFNDLLTDVERMSDHCSNLAGYALADIQHHRNKHAFLDSVKTKSNFATLFEEYQQKYFLNV
jgi:phosphate:Na+ symporter